MSMPASAESSFLEPSGVLQTLPLELVLRIIDTLALDLRNSAPVQARSLFLISRTVCQSILPLLYEVHVSMITVPLRTTGWDGRPYAHPALSFLSWLLCTPSAAPRRHVKNLVFYHRFAFYALELGFKTISFPGESTASKPSWWLDNLIVTNIWDARQLERAGISAHAAHRIDRIKMDSFTNSIGRDAITFAVSLWHEGPDGRGCIRICTQPTDDSSNTDGRQALAGWASAFEYQELDPLQEYKVRELPEHCRGVSIFIDVGSSEGFGDLSVALLDGIAEIFSSQYAAAFHVVAVYPQRESDTIISGAIEKLRARCAAQFHEQLWIARSAADRRLIAQDPYLGIARAFRQGINPWDTGRRISEIILDLVT